MTPVHQVPRAECSRPPATGRGGPSKPCRLSPFGGGRQVALVGVGKARSGGKGTGVGPRRKGWSRPVIPEHSSLRRRRRGRQAGTAEDAGDRSTGDQVADQGPRRRAGGRREHTTRIERGARWSRGATGPGGGRGDGADRRDGKREEITAMTAETTRQHRQSTKKWTTPARAPRRGLGVTLGKIRRGY